MLFEFLVNYKSLNYCICFASNESNYLSFELILEKLIETIKTETNDEISCETHLFQILNKTFNEYVLLIDMKQMVENHSQLRVSAKLCPNRPTTNCGNKSIAKLVMQSQYYSMDRRVADPRLERHRVRLNPIQLQSNLFLIDLIKSNFSHNCEQLSETDWKYISKQMSGHLFQSADSTSDENCWRKQFLFLLQEFKQIVRKSTNYETSCDLFPFFDEFQSMVTKSADFLTFCDHKQSSGTKTLAIIGHKLSQLARNPPKPVSNAQPIIETISETIKPKFFAENIVKLKPKTNESTDRRWEERAKCFCSIVKAIKEIISRNKYMNRFNDWSQLSRLISIDGFESKVRKFAPNCKKFFYQSISYYIKNYSFLKQLEIDLYETVFQLDLRLFYTNDSFYRHLMRFSRTHKKITNNNWDSNRFSKINGINKTINNSNCDEMTKSADELPIKSAVSDVKPRSKVRKSRWDVKNIIDS